LREALEQAKMELADVDAIGVYHGPGLTGGLAGGNYVWEDALLRRWKNPGARSITSKACSCGFSGSAQSRRQHNCLLSAFIVSGGHTVLYEVTAGAQPRLAVPTDT